MDVAIVNSNGKFVLFAHFAPEVSVLDPCLDVGWRMLNVIPRCTSLWVSSGEDTLEGMGGEYGDGEKLSTVQRILLACLSLTVPMPYRYLNLHVSHKTATSYVEGCLSSALEDHHL